MPDPNIFLIGIKASFEAVYRTTFLGEEKKNW